MSLYLVFDVIKMKFLVLVSWRISWFLTVLSRLIVICVPLPSLCDQSVDIVLQTPFFLDQPFRGQRAGDGESSVELRFCVVVRDVSSSSSLSAERTRGVVRQRRHIYHKRRAGRHHHHHFPASWRRRRRSENDEDIKKKERETYGETEALSAKRTRTSASTRRRRRRRRLPKTWRALVFFTSCDLLINARQFLRFLCLVLRFSSRVLLYKRDELR